MTMANFNPSNLEKDTPIWAKRVRGFFVSLFTGIIMYSETVAPWFNMDVPAFDKLMALCLFASGLIFSLFGVPEEKPIQNENE